MELASEASQLLSSAGTVRLPVPAEGQKRRVRKMTHFQGLGDQCLRER